MPLNDNAIVEIGRHYRFQWEPAQQAHVLLYPEGMVKLPGSSGEIMKRVNGASTVGEIIADLERAFPGYRLAGRRHRVSGARLWKRLDPNKRSLTCRSGC